MDKKFFICENINIFDYLGAPGGGGDFNNQTGPILVHIYPLFNNNLHVKYRSNLIRTFILFGVMLGPYIKSRGTRCTEMSVDADLITVETYLQQGKQFVPKCKNKLYFDLFGGALSGSSLIRLGLSCFPAIISLISMFMSNKEAI